MLDSVQAVHWPRLDVFDGNAEALIAAALVAREQLPGQPGTPLDEVIYCRGELVETPKRFRFDARDLPPSGVPNKGRKSGIARLIDLAVG